MEPDRRERLTEYYSIEPKVLPSKEVKPLKYSKLDKFANIASSDNSSPIAWGASSQAVKQNIRINPKKEMQKRERSNDPIGKREIILPDRFKKYEVELYR
jgi:hypothetical protein